MAREERKNGDGHGRRLTREEENRMRMGYKKREMGREKRRGDIWNNWEVVGMVRKGKRCSLFLHMLVPVQDLLLHDGPGHPPARRTRTSSFRKE